MREADQEVVKEMKSTNYKIGKEGNDAPNEKQTTNKTQFANTERHLKEEPRDISRRADPNNPNRVLSFGFGFGAETGTKEII